MPISGFPLLPAEGVVTVTADNADFVVSAWLVAVTVTVVVETTDGAVKSPLLEIVPAEDAHVTAVFVEPLTVATNCCVVPEDSVSLVGVIEMDTPAGAAALMVMGYCAVLLALSCTVIVDV